MKSKCPDVILRMRRIMWFRRFCTYSKARFRLKRPICFVVLFLCLDLVQDPYIQQSYNGLLQDGHLFSFFFVCSLGISQHFDLCCLCLACFVFNFTNINPCTSVYLKWTLPFLNSDKPIVPNWGFSKNSVVRAVSSGLIVFVKLPILVCRDKS